MGLTAGFSLWSFQELSRFILSAEGELNNWAIALQGFLICGLLGAITLGQEGYLQQNFSRMIQGIRIGLFAGGFGGMVGFWLIDRILSTSGELSVLFKALISSQSWLLPFLMIGVSFGLRDQSNLQLQRGLFAAIATSLFGAFTLPLISLLPLRPPHAEDLTLFLLGFGFIQIMGYFGQFRRTEWIKSLNGELEGLEFELHKHIHYLGTQNLDRINLSGYPDINSTHAKLIKYHCGYSLLDNDPFGRTWLNFRSVTEQPLKNGDIIKVGTAVFQYLKKKP